MNDRIREIAALANVAGYNKAATKKYIDGAPHIKHSSLRTFYGGLVVQIFDDAKKNANIPTVLDLGAGEGSVTLPFLELGAHVTAVDISESQLEELKVKCDSYGDMLKVHCADIDVFLKESNVKYDIIVINSFLHHVPDYMNMIQMSVKLLSSKGQFFTFQDPLRYDSLRRIDLAFSNLSYLSWRVFKGDVIGGLKRRVRRARGSYLEDSVHDNVEYHVVRNGVNQDAIQQFFLAKSMGCKIISYFSTQSRLFQFVGSKLGMKNTFAVVANKSESSLS